MAATDKVVLYPPGMEAMAAQLCEALGVSTPVCSNQISTALSASPTLCWERFPSGDANVKVRTELRRLNGRDANGIHEQGSIASSRDRPS